VLLEIDHLVRVRARRRVRVRVRVRVRARCCLRSTTLSRFGCSARKRSSEVLSSTAWQVVTHAVSQ